MNLFDTHAHFSCDAEKTAATLARAYQAGVTQLMAVGGSPELNRAAMIAAACAETVGEPQAGSAANARPRVRLALGLDRDQATSGNLSQQLSALAPQLSTLNPQLSAVGEIGLDFHYAPETAKAQCDLFAAQLELARELNLPVVIHTRDADDATLGVLDENDFHNGIVHCFTGSVPFERQLLDRGFMISISGIVTFRAAENVREAARYAPDDRLLVETDSPFLAPVPMRGSENEPAFLPHTVRFLAEQRKTTAESLALLTTNNAEKLLRPGTFTLNSQPSTRNS